MVWSDVNMKQNKWIIVAGIVVILGAVLAIYRHKMVTRHVIFKSVSFTPIKSPTTGELMARWVNDEKDTLIQLKECIKSQSNSSLPSKKRGQEVCLTLSTRASEIMQSIQSGLDMMKGFDKANVPGTRAATQLTDRISTLSKMIEEINKIPSTPPFDKGGMGGFIFRIDQVIRYIDSFQPSHKTEVLGATLLPYQSSPYVQSMPAAGNVTPVYDMPGPEQMNLASTLPLTVPDPRIASYAQQFNGDPIAAYDYIKNNYIYEPYYGSMEGPIGAMALGSGNDADLNGLLIETFKAMGFPARYVIGTIFLPVSKAENLYGVEDGYQLLKVLRSAGIPYEPMVGGGSITGVTLTHIWAEVYVPYGNYRGAVIDWSNPQWIPLDVTMKGIDSFSYTQGHDIFTELGMDPIALTQSYLAATGFSSPMDYYRSQINSAISSAMSGLGYTDAIRTRSPNPEHMGILPSTLPYKTLDIQGEYLSLPVSYMHYIYFKLVTQNGLVALNVSMPASSLSGREVIVAFTGATANDVNKIQSFGGLDNVPSALVNVVPMILVDDNQYAPSYIAAQGAVPMSVGDESKLIMDIYTPNGVNEVSTGIVSGSVLALSILNGYSSISPLSRGAGGVSSSGGLNVLNLSTVFTQGMNLLYNSASDQGSNWNSAESEISGFSGVRVVHPEVSIVAAKPVINVSTTLGIVTGMQTTGAALDALTRISSAIPISPDTGVSTKGFMYLSGYEGSYLEEKAFEDVLGVESISTMKLLRLAVAQGITIVTINQQNIGTVLNTISTGLDMTNTQAIQTNITNLVNQGLEIQIPISGTTYQAFTGTGYIAINLTTGEGGYYLSGNLHGGMTVLALVYWPPDLGLPLIEPNEHIVPPDTAPNAVTQLVLVSPNWSVGTVGQFLKAPIIIQALDSAGVPVEGATITFTLGNGEGGVAPYDMSSFPIFPQPPGPMSTSNTISIVTGYTGEAGVWFELGLHTKDNPIYYKQPNEQNVTQALVNTLNAISQNNIGLQGGYTAIGKPEVAAALVSISDIVGTEWASYAGFVSVAAEDQYNNPVSNIPVTFNRIPMQYNGNGVPPAGGLDMVLVPEENLGVNGCPALPTLDNAGICGAGSGPKIETTDFRGVTMGIISGNVNNTTYGLRASSPGLKDLTYTYVYSGNFSNTYVEYVYPNINSISDIYGNIINAGIPGSSQTLNMHVYETHNTCTWDGCQASCTDVWSVPELTNATINTSTISGTGHAGNANPTGPGAYTIPITLGNTAEQEVYGIEATINAVGLPAGCNINPSGSVTGVVTTTTETTSEYCVFDNLSFLHLEA